MHRLQVNQDEIPDEDTRSTTDQDVKLEYPDDVFRKTKGHTVGIKANDKGQQAFRKRKSKESSRKALKHLKRDSMKTETKFACKDCGKTFTRIAHLHKHNTTHSAVKPYKCGDCGKFFKSKDGRKLHMVNFHGPFARPNLKIESDNKTFQCHLCKGMYISASALRKHEIRVHTRDGERLEKLEALVDFSEEIPTVQESHQDESNNLDLLNNASEESKGDFACNVCSRLFKTNRDLKNHQITHETGKTTYDCDICNRVYQHPIALYRHKQMHTKSGKFTCKICGKKYATISYLRKHSKLHKADPPFKCDFCQKTFHEKRCLQYHLNIHTKENPFMCDQCGKAFPRPQQLRKHARIHSDERPYKCDQCGKAFKQNDTLRAHKETHNPFQDFMCQVCGRTFNRAYNLRKHEKVHLESSYDCKECGKLCKSAASLKSHFISFHLKPEDVPNYKYSVWQCDICLKPFAERLDRDAHRRSHTGEKPYACEYCDKAFADKSNLRAHIRNHQGEKSKLCNVCGKGFTFNRDLKKHMQTHANSNKTTELEKPKPVKKSATTLQPPPTWTTSQQTASVDALSAAYALSMAREATMQPVSNVGTTSEFPWQYL